MLAAFAARYSTLPGRLGNWPVGFQGCCWWIWHWIELLQRASALELAPRSVHAVGQPLPVLVGLPVDNRLRFYAIVAAKLADAIVMEYGSVGGYVQCAVAGYELPDKVIAGLNDVRGLADVLGALLVRMQFRLSPSFAQRYQPSLRARPRRGNLCVVRPLQVEKSILEGERSR